MNETSMIPMGDTQATPSDAIELRARATNETSWLMCLAHFGTCFSWFLAPLVVWLYARNDRVLGPRALAVLLWSLLGTAAAAATCGLAIPVFLVVHVWAGIRELREQPYAYPLADDFAKSLYR